MDLQPPVTPDQGGAGQRRWLLLASVALLSTLAGIGLLRLDESRGDAGASLARDRVPIPVAPSGWRTVWQDDFNAPTVDPTRWFTYSGEPDQGPGAWWEPSHVTSSGGLLRVTAVGEPDRGGQLVTGGLNSSLGDNYVYGRYLARVRVDAARDVAFAVLLVTPQGRSGNYVVIASDDGGTRELITGGVKGRSQSGAPIDVTESGAFDLKQWHTVGVEWSPGKLSLTVDGRTWGEVKSPFVPSGPLALAIQTQAVCAEPKSGVCLATSKRPVDLQVDWVTVLASDARG
ncbi:MAG: glycoside hydrolase family 16 protein [Mycobacteriales bacterium]